MKVLLTILLFLSIGMIWHIMPIKDLINETKALEYQPIDLQKGPKNIMIFDSTLDVFVPFRPLNTNEDSVALSIIVPIHNVEKYLVECLESIIKYNDTKYEIILIENNSTDKSLEIAKSYARNYANIILITQDGGGLGAARNTGIIMAKGEYITFIDSDDYYTDKAINIAMANIANDKPDLVIFSFYYYDNITKQVSNKQKIKFKNQEIIYTKDYNFETINKNIYCVVWGRFYKRSILFNKGILFKNNLYHEDNLFMLMLFTQDIKIKFVDEPLIYYRVNRTGSIMHSVPNINHILTVYDQFKIFLVQEGKYDEFESIFLDSEIRAINYKTKSLDKKSKIALWKYCHDRYTKMSLIEKNIKPISSKNLKIFNHIMEESYLLLTIQQDLGLL
jgi:glycosyltransferase involved in cell wall biosynthesis